MIRPASLDDAEPVAALIRAAYGGYVALLGRDPQPMTDDYPALIQAGEVFVMMLDDGIAGVLVVQQPEWGSMLVRTVAIAPERQRQGLGTRLMAFAEEVANDRDLGRMQLYTNEVMTGTARLYARLGYAETRREGPDGRQVVYMAKELPLGRTPWYDVIVTDADTCFGKPRITGTRHYIDFLLTLIERGGSFDTIIADYPDLDRVQLKAMMGFVRDVVAAKRNALRSEHDHG